MILVVCAMQADQTDKWRETKTVRHTQYVGPTHQHNTHTK